MASNFKFWMSPIGENVNYVWGDKKCYLLDNIEKQDKEVKEERITLKKPAKKADAVTTYSFMEMPVITLKRNKKQKI